MYNWLVFLHIFFAFLFMLAHGVHAAAFITPWWKQGWTWASAVVFAIISWVMCKYGTGYYTIIFDAATTSSKQKDGYKLARRTKGIR